MDNVVNFLNSLTGLQVVSLVYVIFGMFLAYVVMDRSRLVQVGALLTYSGIVGAFIISYTWLCAC